MKRISKMEGLLGKYSQGLPQPRNNTTPRNQQGLTIVLKESTGLLRSDLLDCLLNNTQVKKVICLNRGADRRNEAEEQQQVARLDH